MKNNTKIKTKLLALSSCLFLSTASFSSDTQRDVEKSYNKALSKEEKALTPDENYNLGIAYFKGDIIFPEKPDVAAHYFKLAAQHKHVYAHFLLGTMYHDGNGVIKDIPTSVAHYKIAADLGHIQSQLVTGHNYENGTGFDKDIKTAYKYYYMAAYNGYAIAQVIVAKKCLEDVSNQKNLEIALNFFGLAAFEGNAEAQYFLGFMQANGLGCEKDLDMAFNTFKAAADQGFPEAQYNAGLFYQKGNGTKIDLEKAIKYYKPAADANIAEAQINLANIYHNYEGFQNPDLALTYYRKAASNNNLAALLILGEFYTKGDIIEQSYLKAKTCFDNIIAIINKLDPITKEDLDIAVKALKNLGDFYSKGYGVRQDMKQASAFYKSASELDYARIQRIIEEEGAKKIAPPPASVSNIEVVPEVTPTPKRKTKSKKKTPIKPVEILVVPEPVIEAPQIPQIIITPADAPSLPLPETIFGPLMTQDDINAHLREQNEGLIAQNYYIAEQNYYLWMENDKLAKENENLKKKIEPTEDNLREIHQKSIVPVYENHNRRRTKSSPPKFKQS